jgi:hypothetical protein
MSGPVQRPQDVVLRMTVGAYTDAAAAHNQHERNLADEGASGSNEAQSELGNVTAGLVQHAGDSVLLTSVDRFTLDLGLPPHEGRYRPRTCSPTSRAGCWHGCRLCGRTSPPDAAADRGRGPRMATVDGDPSLSAEITPSKDHLSDVSARLQPLALLALGGTLRDPRGRPSRSDSRRCTLEAAAAVGPPSSTSVRAQFSTFNWSRAGAK